MSTTIELPFAIGETLWTPGYGNAKRRVQCPECCGTTVIEMTKGNGEKVSLHCDYCKPSWEGPKGWVEVDAWKSAPEMFIPRRWGMSGNDFMFSEESPDANCYSSRYAKDLFRTREECAVRCAEMDAEREKNNEESALRRLSNSRGTLSRNASTWSKRVNDLTRDLERVRAMLARCKVKPTVEVTP